MEWLVIDIVYLRERGICILVLRASSLKMMAEVSSEVSVQVGDILHPVKDATYLINKNKNLRLKIISASVFSATQWYLLKKNILESETARTML